MSSILCTLFSSSLIIPNELALYSLVKLLSPLSHPDLTDGCAGELT